MKGNPFEKEDFSMTVDTEPVWTRIIVERTKAAYERLGWKLGEEPPQDLIALHRDRIRKLYPNMTDQDIVADLGYLACTGQLLKHISNRDDIPTELIWHGLRYPTDDDIFDPYHVLDELNALAESKKNMAMP